jgi:transposase
MTKSGREIMEIFEAFDLTGTAWSAAQLTGCDAKTVARYVAIREAGGDPPVRAGRPKLIDAFMPKIEELVDRSKGKIRADVAHRKITAMGYGGSERSTRRAVAEVKAAWHTGRRRRYRPWIPEPGMWLQWDWGDGPRIGGRKTQLFSAWLAWSRFRVVIPARDQQLGTLTWCLDRALRQAGGAPAYLLTDNPKTVTVDHVAGIAVRHPEMVAVGRHYGCTVATCVPFDPESKGGVEATVKIAKADLVPSDANLLPAYGSFGELEEACRQFCSRVNGRVHRESAAVPADRLAAEREMRLVGDDQTVRFGSVRYSTPPGHARTRVWCGVAGQELVITARTAAGAAEIARHRLSVPGSPQICDEHYPDHPGGNGPRQPKPRPRTQAEAAFLVIGDGARRWLAGAAASGAARIRSKMARAVELAAVVGADRVDAALGLAAIADRFADGDLASIIDIRALTSRPGTAVRRVLQFLDDRGMLIPDPARQGTAVERTIQQHIQSLPEPIAGEVRQWVKVVRGDGRRAHQELPYSTVRSYLNCFYPVLAGWSQHVTSLREITRDDVQTALGQHPGARAHNLLPALRSLFRALKQEKITFRDPVRGITMRTMQRLPAPIPSDLLRGLIDRAGTPIAKVIVALIATHALGKKETTFLLTEDLNLSRGQLAVRRPTGTHTVYLDDLSRTLMTGWLRERHRCWPLTRNPHLLVTRHTAIDTAGPPIAHTVLDAIFGDLGLTPSQVRQDRILDEARHTADPRPPHARLQPVSPPRHEVHPGSPFALLSGPAVKKSGATIPCAWDRRNSAQPGPSRRGARLIPAFFRICQIVDGATVILRPASSPWIRRYPTTRSLAPAAAPPTAPYGGSPGGPGATAAPTAGGRCRGASARSCRE